MSKVIVILVALCLVSCHPIYFGETVTYSANQTNYNKIYRLDLSHQNLRELPTDIGKFTNLTFINLSNNPSLDLEEAFKALARLTELTVLILDSNELHILPQNIGQLTSIKHISLVYNPAIKLEDTFNQLQTLPNFTTLNLSHNNLNEIPENIKTNLHLSNLRLSYNSINTSTSISRLATVKKLKYLWLDHNDIEKLPAEIGELTQMSELYLGNNAISELPNEIEKCNNLCVLYLGDNQFKSLPEQIIDMRILYMLVIYGNKISEISEDFQKLKSPLAILVLDKNKLSSEQIKIAKKYFTGFFLLSVKNQEAS